MSSKSSKKNKQKPIPSRNWFFNKYALSLIAFIIWVSFFDNHNILEQRKMTSNIKQLEEEIHGYQSKLGEIKQEEEDLANNIEKLAREKYKFGAPNEDIFIIEPKKEIQK